MFETLAFEKPKKRERQRQRDRETKRQRDRETERQRETERDIVRETERTNEGYRDNHGDKGKVGGERQTEALRGKHGDNEGHREADEGIEGETAGGKE